MSVGNLGRALVAFSALGSLLAACGDSGLKAQGKSSPPPPPQVTVSKPLKKLVADHDEYVGRFVAVDFVEVRARVSGYLDAIHFEDGQIVRKGDPLFTIDPRTFQAVLDQQRASLAQAEANMEFAKSNLKRAQRLVEGTTITQQTLDERIQGERAAEATVAAQKAAIRQAELDLEFTNLKAPVSGRIGDRRVAVGNLVSGGTSGTTTLLATIASVDPIRFEFTLDEASYLRYLRHAQKQADPKGRELNFGVQLKLIDEADYTHKGTMNFVDNVIERSSGTIRARADFPNPDGKLTPGMFGRIQLAARAPAEALLVPDTAIGTEQVRKYVMAVDKENVARPKYVKLGALVDDMRVITEGLSPDDRVIIKGLMRVRPGSKVTPQEASQASASAQDATVN